MFSFTTFAKTTAIAAAFGAVAWAGYEFTRAPYAGTTGITYGAAFAPARQTEVDFHIWYPAQPGGRAITVGGNGVFYGTPAGRDAPHITGRHPMVILSHGAGGNAGQFGWIAAALAEAGFVVVLPNHPGTTTGNASAEAAVRVWERPKDVSAVLDEITGHPDVYPYIDTTRIASLGFSAGGYTAMALSGARVNPDLLQRFCDETDHGMSDCAFLTHFGIDLHDFDLSPAAQDLTDPRIKAAVIVDPGIVETITPESLKEISTPMFVINLGAEETVPLGVYAKEAAALMPRASYTAVPDAIHFSFLAECKPKGPLILEKEGELDALCDDAGGRSRADIHRQLTQMIVSNLQSAL
ncbi:MAG: prolyl oligopeptidase family serine peptidase [Sulfitobacter sp.]